MRRLRFDGRSAIVTGAGRGIGREYARLLAARGASVLVNDLGVDDDGSGRDPMVAQSVVREIAEAGGRAAASGDDVSTARGARRAVARALEAFGRVDIVVCNAGFVTRVPFPAVSLGSLRQHLRTDPGGAFNVCRAAWPHLGESGQGRVLVTTSAAAFGSETSLAYGTAKASNIGLAWSLAAQGRARGIHVNVVAPFAYTRMAMSKTTLSASQLKDRQERAKPQFVAAAALYLLHETCSETGRLFAVGAGRIAALDLVESGSYAGVDLTPEDVVENWHQVCAADAGTATRVSGSESYIAHYYEAAAARQPRTSDERKEHHG